MSQEEQRRSDRIRQKFVLRAALDDGNPWPTWSLVTAHDISATGVCFTFDRPAKPGDILFLKLHFMDRVIDCRAQVVRLTPGTQKPLVQLAANLLDLRPEDVKFIEAHVKEVKNNKKRRQYEED